MVQVDIRSESWEPAVITLTFSQETPPESGVESICIDWFRQRDAESTCPCHLSFLKALDTPRNSLQIFAEWLCSKCLPELIQRLADSLPGLDRVEIGLPASSTSSVESGIEWVRVNAKEVEFEDGARVFVPAFEVSWYPISVRQFQEFATSAGYVTTAERQGEYETYLSNQTLKPLTAAERDASPVSCVSYYDAVACAAWYGARLPTEAEWLAGAIVEQQILDEKAYERERFGLRRQKPFLQWLTSEWTGSIDESGQGVIRTGPKWARTVDWTAKRSRHRMPADAGIYDVMITFRIARSVPPGNDESGPQ